MARFEIKSPVPDWTGVSAGVTFARGRAVVTSDTGPGLAALSYFKTAGYGIAALDGMEIDEVLTRANEDPATEHARLTREIAQGENRLELDDLRKRKRALDDKIFKADESDVDVSTGNTGTTQVELQAPPAENASVTEWRRWAVDSGRATESEVKGMDKPTIIARHGAAYDAERAEQLKLASAAEAGAAL